MDDITPVLLCGGSGTRLWPLSRQSYPKQFVPLTGPETLFQASARRLSGDGFADPIIVTADAFRFIVAEQLDAVRVKPRVLLIEPEGRDTAPAVLAATLSAAKRHPSGLVLVAPSDHVIPDAGAFRAAVQRGRAAAEAGRIVTFGIRPDRPETGYGYLELAGHAVEGGAQALAKFVEKPDATRAAVMIEDGLHLWNAGIFLFRADAMLAAAEAAEPDLLAAVRAAYDGAEPDLDFCRLDPAAWSRARKVSIDVAVMERTDGLAVVPYDGGWSDLGDWASVARETDGHAGPVLSLDCERTLLRAESPGQQVVGIGLTDIIAVAMPDAVLVAHRDRAQEVKQAVERMRADGVRQADTLPRDHRPWGWFESLALGDRFQVKRIVVKPGAALSLQSHHHRSEHWIVVQGTARVTVGAEVRLLGETESIYIPLGAKHRLENPGKLPMVLIEVQTGPYLGEDDIVRYEDRYARG